MFLSLMRVCVVYVVKLCHSGGFSQLMGLVHKKTHIQALQTAKRKLRSLCRNWN